MKNKIILYSSIALVTLFVSGCCNSAALLHAPNNKDYYVDTCKCNTYTLKKDSLYCHDLKDESFEKVYQPVTFGYEVGTRIGY